MADNASRAGERYATSQILDWLSQTHHPPTEGLAQAFSAPANHGMPEIQVGAAEGRTLQLLLTLVGARRVVEIGTLAGYSALWMARALPEQGHLWTLEADQAHAEVARESIAAAGEAHRITVIEGDASELLPTLTESGPFCAVFLDADKARYDLYGRWATDNLRKGGLLIGDNAYLFGNLLDDSKAANAMRRFHQDMAANYLSVCLPTADGLAVGIRRKDET
ncbi:MAG: O-methyltransferase [Myxococcota bacterium]